ncbi:DNRLRE domain-containing protein [Aeromicrobium sp.]|uniref:DNRLRE domain-containing protein n=1 Tax=Aeromicrobium sp. TaxID=1871063 RepID=UPI0019903077|nr:DNRLRE domain-containing protein [Aeromicrobium sp.]MBC7633267.1 DNRLRE domain-containing protein [Aeromicrobium sp.]
MARSIVLFIATAGLLAPFTVAVAAAAEDTDPQVVATLELKPVDSDDDGTLDAPDTATAIAAASSTDKPVEDFSQRTETKIVIANPDGTFTSKEYATPVRIKRDGDWVDVDYTLIKNADGSWAPKASPIDVSIAGGPAKEAARVTFDDDESLAVTWPANLPEPTVSGGIATYKLSNATDLLIATTSSGLNAHIRLNQQPTDDDPIFTLGLRAEGVDVNQNSSGGLQVSGDDGKTIAKTSSLVAWDASTDPAGDPATVVKLDATLDETSASGDVTQHTLDLTTPDGFLSDPTTQYPVTIDPDISMNQVRDTWVRSGDTTSRGAENRLIVGKIDPSVSSNSNPARSYLKFFNSTIENNPAIDIVSAEMGLWQYYGYTCADRRMYVYPVGVPWGDTITWANAPAIVYGAGATHITTNRAASGCADGWTKVNLTNMARAWGDGTVDMQGVRLSAGDEDYSSYERRFCSMNTTSGTDCGAAARTPYFSVTYNTRPNSASSVTADVVDSVVTFSSVAVDLDGGPVRVKYVVSQSAATVLTVFTPFGLSGDELALDIDTLSPGTYDVRAWVDDGQAGSAAASAPVSFTVTAVGETPGPTPTEACDYKVEMSGQELTVEGPAGAPSTPPLIESDTGHLEYRGTQAGKDVDVKVWMGASDAALAAELEQSAETMNSLESQSVNEAVDGDQSDAEVSETFTPSGVSQSQVPIAYRLVGDDTVEFGKPNTTHCGQLSPSAIAANDDVVLGTVNSALILPLSADSTVSAAETYPETTGAIRYRTFIPAKKATTGPVCGTFKGDNRGFTSYFTAPSRTRASMFFNWPNKTIDTTKSIGTTHRLKAYGFSAKSKTASAKGIKFHTPLMYSTYGKMSVTHSVGNPLCSVAGAIRYNLVFEAWKTKGARVTGTRGKVPNHEAYFYPKTEASGKRIFTRKSSKYICLSVNCGDESIWETWVP